MTAWTLDIKVPNDLEKMATKTAKALDQVTMREAKLNKLLDKGVKSGKVSDALAKKARSEMTKYKKGMLDASAKELVFGKKKGDDEKKQMSLVDKLSKHYLILRDAVKGAFSVIKAMTVDAMESGNELTKMTKAMQFEVDRFTSSTKLGEQFHMLEKFSAQLGKGAGFTKELTDQFVKLRRASTPINLIDNAQAAQMVAVYADMRAISQSSEQAGKFIDEWIEKFKEGPSEAARFLQLTKDSHKEWAKIGTGAFAKTSKGPLDIEDKADKASNKMASALAPLTKLMNDLKASFSDFMMKLAGNKTFKNFISEVAKDIRWFITEGLPAFGKGIASFYDTLGKESEKFLKTSGSVMDKVGGFFKGIIDFVDIPGAVKKHFDEPRPQGPAPMKNDAGEKSLGGSKAFNAPTSGRQLAGITIQNLNVQGNAQEADQIGRSVRQELQLLIQAGALSKGYA